LFLLIFMLDLYYKYDITYLSSQDSPSKNNGKSVVQGKIKEFFPLKDRIMIRFYIKIVSLNFFEIFHSLINFKYFYHLFILISLIFI